jgi:hypothetical protein
VNEKIAWKLHEIKNGAQPWYVKDIADEESDSDEVLIIIYFLLTRTLFTHIKIDLKIY